MPQQDVNPQPTVGLHPNEAAASLAFATSLQQNMLRSAPGSPQDGSGQPMQAQPQSDPQAEILQIAEVFSAKIDSLRTEMQNTIKEQIGSIRQDVQKIIEEEQGEDKNENENGEQ